MWSTEVEGGVDGDEVATFSPPKRPRSVLVKSAGNASIVTWRSAEVTGAALVAVFDATGRGGDRHRMGVPLGLGAILRPGVRRVLAHDRVGLSTIARASAAGVLISQIFLTTSAVGLVSMYGAPARRE
ncbi:MAG: hypothetical protein ACJAR2_000447 [Ilumatobacter sp.]